MPKILAIGESVIDHLHPHAADDENGRDVHRFIAMLPQLLPEGMLPHAPRAGDCIDIPQEQLHTLSQQFLIAAGRPVADHPVATLLGMPVLEAGGSLANTVASLAWSRVAGQSVADITYVTVQDEGAEGDAFRAAMPQGVVQGPVGGRCLRVHVIPTLGDRVMISSPSLENPTGKRKLTDAIATRLTPDTDIVMLEGFLAFGQHFEENTGALLDRITAVNALRGNKGPLQLVLTASSQTIAAKAMFAAFFRKAVTVTDVMVHANAGEFRRLVGDDRTWRYTFDDANNHPFAGLDGAELEKAKRANAAYQHAKARANHEIIHGAALPMIAQSPYKLGFVVTDGKKPVRVVDANGVQEMAIGGVPAEKIVNTVGAGDAFMAGFWLERLFGGSVAESLKAGAAFSAKVITQSAARLPSDGTRGTYAGPAVYLPRALNL